MCANAHFGKARRGRPKLGPWPAHFNSRPAIWFFSSVVQTNICLFATLIFRNVFYVFVIREGNIFLTRKLFLQVFGQALIAYIIFAVLIIDPSHFVFVLKRFYNLLIPINNLEQFARSITYNAVDARDCQLEEERREATPIFPLIIRNPGIEVTWRVTTADRTFKFVSFFFPWLLQTRRCFPHRGHFNAHRWNITRRRRDYISDEIR